MKLSFVAALVAALGLLDCGGTQSSPKAPTTDQYRQAVLVAKDAWVLTADACVDVYASTQDVALIQGCRAVLNPAHDLIVAAATTVDSVGHADLCGLEGVVKQVASVSAALGAKAGPAATLAVGQALQLFDALAPQCADAGGK